MKAEINSRRLGASRTSTRARSWLHPVIVAMLGAFAQPAMAQDNNPPASAAGPDVSGVEGATVQLDGTGSYDPEFLPLTYQWTQLSGPHASVTGAQTASLSVTIPSLGGVGGDLTFRLTVTDDVGQTSSDTALVVVLPSGAVTRQWSYQIINTQPMPSSVIQLSMNSYGQATYVTQSPTIANIRTWAIHVSDGISDNVVFSMVDDVNVNGGGILSVGVDDSGRVTFVGSLEGQIGEATYRIVNGAAVPVPGALTANSSVANNQGVFARLQQPAAGGLAELAVFDSAGNVLAVPLYSNGGAGIQGFAGTLGPVLNDRNDVVAVVTEVLSGGQVRTRARFWQSSQGNGASAYYDNILLQGSNVRALGNISLNDGGAAVYTTRDLATSVGQVTLVQGATGSWTIAQTGTGPDSLSAIYDGAAVNNNYHVAFAAQELTGARQGLFIGTVGDPRIPVMFRGDLLNGNPVILGAPFNYGVYSKALNDHGQVLFPVTISGQNYLVRATAALGVLADRPLLPEADSSPGVYRFRCPAVISGRCYFDPPVATGYEYAVEGSHPYFASFLIPVPPPGGDAQYLVEYAGSGGPQPAMAGQIFSFPAAGVSTFRLTGIDGVTLDPNRHAPFVSGVTFVAQRAEGDSFTMTPIVAAPADQDGDGVPDTTDLCPGTAAGAAVNANGCSTAQLDSDGDGVADSADLCPNTPPGAAVNAAGCSATQRDTDGDGVNDSLDACPNTPPGTAVDAVGCPIAPPDSDGDGVADSADLCPNTPVGAVADANGCSATQRDTDRDGVNDSLDACPGTPSGTAVDAVGCPIVQVGRKCDADRDGDVDLYDINAILAAFRQSASGGNDPRDADGSGRIDLRDAAICATKCDRWLCRSP